MGARRLRLNPTKTQIMWLGSKQQLEKVVNKDINTLSTSLHAVDSARDLGVVLDSQLTMAAHVSMVCQTGYYQLRQFRPVVRSLSSDAAGSSIVQAFIHSRLDYCNALLNGITDALFKRLQSVQNAAARLITGARRGDHITPC
jgi:hypothetical protein